MMILKINDRIGFGAYADIFRTPPETLACKLFASGQHPTNVRQGLTRTEDDARRRKTFLSECEACRRAGQHPYLRNHIPRFAGRCAIRDVIDGTRSVAHHYMLDHCYAMEYIPDVAEKLGDYPRGSLPRHIEEALNAFREAGICHVKDASVFFLNDPDNFEFIDFATEEFEVSW
jgi:hypothetical protein